MVISKYYAVLFSCLLFSEVVFCQRGSIVVKVTGNENIKGKVRIGLYNKKENFIDYDKVFARAVVDPTNKGVEYTFDKIPKGGIRYCFMA